MKETRGAGGVQGNEEYSVNNKIFNVHRQRVFVQRRVSTSRYVSVAFLVFDGRDQASRQWVGVRRLGCSSFV